MSDQQAGKLSIQGKEGQISLGVSDVEVIGKIPEFIGLARGTVQSMRKKIKQKQKTEKQKREAVIHASFYIQETVMRTLFMSSARCKEDEDLVL